MRSNVFLWLPTGFGKSICYETLPLLCNYKYTDGGTGGGRGVVLVVSSLVSLVSHCHVNTLQAEYLGLVISLHNNDAVEKEAEECLCVE